MRSLAIIAACLFAILPAMRLTRPGGTGAGGDIFRLRTKADAGYAFSI
jgi:hypothetical protein